MKWEWQLAFPGSGSDLKARGGSRFYWCLFYFCFYFEPVKIEGVTLPEVAETAAVEQDNWLPKLDVPDVIQQKVIPGKKEGGQVQHDPPQKKSCHPSASGEASECLSSSFEWFVWKRPLLLSTRGCFFGLLSPPGSHAEGHVSPWAGGRTQEPPQLWGQAR